MADAEWKKRIGIAFNFSSSEDEENKNGEDDIDRWIKTCLRDSTLFAIQQSRPSAWRGEGRR